jgi:hypothetical protein
VEGLKLIDSSFKLFSLQVCCQEACSWSRAVHTEEERRMRNVEKEPKGNNWKKRGFTEKEFREKNEEKSSYIKTKDVNEVEKITFLPTLFICLSSNFLSSFTFCSFLLTLLLFFSFSLFLYLNKSRFSSWLCRVAISHVNLLSLTMAFTEDV